MLDYLKRFLIAGIMALCVSLLFFGGKPQASNLVTTIDWIWPTDGIISDTYGTRFGHHKGIDIAGSINTPIIAVDDGKVTKSYYSDTYGHVVFIKHSNNLETVYAHLNKREVQEDQEINKGQIIGRMGNTGKSNGVHLHFEVHEKEWTFEKENAFNPEQVLGEVEVGNLVQATEDNRAQYVVKHIMQEKDELSDGKSSSTIHKVKSGETLWSIAQNYGTTIENIQLINTIRDSKIYENQALKVPKLEKDVYEVQEGDTLSSISIKTELSIDEIKRMNNLQNDVIFPLQKLNLPNQ
jgi:murein DD-endopeptidase MepM/ murein hydrolase activator NlpD